MTDLTPHAYRPLPLEFTRLDPATGLARSAEFRTLMASRRTVRKSVGIACGLLLASPGSPPPPFLVVPIGCPDHDAVVPDLTRKTLAEVLVRI